MFSKVKVITHHFFVTAPLLLTVYLLQTQTTHVYTKLQYSPRFKDNFRTTILYQTTTTVSFIIPKPELPDNINFLTWIWWSAREKTTHCDQRVAALHLDRRYRRFNPWLEDSLPSNVRFGTNVVSLIGCGKETEQRNVAQLASQLALSSLSGLQIWQW